MSSELSLSKERWVGATHNAMQSFAANLGSYLENLTSLGGWCAIDLTQFPCQKSDASPRCEGWVRLSQNSLFVPSEVSPCPCNIGRRSLVAPLLSVAQELCAELSLTELKKSFHPGAFQRFSHDAELRSGLMMWLHWAARRQFRSSIDSDWISSFSETTLTSSQRQSLKWWARISELSQLIHNQAFTVVTRTAVEHLYRQGQAVSVHRAISQLSLSRESLVVLFLNGPELSRSTNQSSRLDWMDALFSALDESELGLVVLSKHPLFAKNGSTSEFSRRSGFRWKSSQIQEHTQLPFERLLPRGSWDRLLELLARADYRLSKIP
ncbi:MAG: hypothetical protein RJB13_716 [Pseudomonadota bacterium]